MLLLKKEKLYHNCNLKNKDGTRKLRAKNKKMYFCWNQQKIQKEVLN